MWPSLCLGPWRDSGPPAALPPSISPGRSPHRVPQPAAVGTPLPGPGAPGGDPVWGRGPSLLRGPLQPREPPTSQPSRVGFSLRLQRWGGRGGRRASAHLRAAPQVEGNPRGLSPRCPDRGAILRSRSPWRCRLRGTLLQPIACSRCRVLTPRNSGKQINTETRQNNLGAERVSNQMQIAAQGDLNSSPCSVTRQRERQQPGKVKKKGSEHVFRSERHSVKWPRCSQLLGGSCPAHPAGAWAAAPPGPR